MIIPIYARARVCVCGGDRGERRGGGCAEAKTNLLEPDRHRRVRNDIADRIDVTSQIDSQNNSNRQLDSQTAR